MKIGFVGLGKLGLPVALAIEDKGHTVLGYDVDPNIKKILEKKKFHIKKKVQMHFLKKARSNLQVYYLLLKIVI